MLSVKDTRPEQTADVRDLSGVTVSKYKSLFRCVYVGKRQYSGAGMWPWDCSCF